MGVAVKPDAFEPTDGWFTTGTGGAECARENGTAASSAGSGGGNTAAEDDNDDNDDADSDDDGDEDKDDMEAGGISIEAVVAFV